MDTNLIENLKKGLIETIGQVQERMSDIEKEQYHIKNIVISLENITHFLNEHSDRIKKEIDNPDFQDLFNKRLDMKITCFANFWEELDNGR